MPDVTSDGRLYAVVCETCGLDHSRNGRAYDGAPCTCGEGELRRLVRVRDGEVIAPGEAVETARDELARLIERTGGPDGFEVGQHERKASTPLALARLKLDRAQSGATPEVRKGLGAAVSTIIEVGEVTGEEVNPEVDPLTGRTFAAFAALSDALDRSTPWPVDHIPQRGGSDQSDAE